MNTQWTNNETMRSIDLLVITFFDDLGKFIIESKETGEGLGYGIIIPSYVDRMQNIAKSADFIHGTFNCGTSAEVASKLWGLNVSTHPGISMSYEAYVDNICKEFHKLIGE